MTKTIDGGAQLAIQLAIEKTNTVYIARSPIGTTLDLCPTFQEAFGSKAKCPGAKIYKRVGDAMYPVA